MYKLFYLKYDTNVHGMGYAVAIFFLNLQKQRQLLWKLLHKYLFERKS